MRAVIDHHVDRPEVEVQQCMQPTGTNRSIGLIFFDDGMALGMTLRVTLPHPIASG